MSMMSTMTIRDLGHKGEKGLFHPTAYILSWSKDSGQKLEAGMEAETMKEPLLTALLPKLTRSYFSYAS